MGTEYWSTSEVAAAPGLLSYYSMGYLPLVLLLTIFCQALAEDVQLVKEPEVADEGVTLRDDLKAMMLMQKRDLQLGNSRSIQRTGFPDYPPGEYKLSFGDDGTFVSPNFPGDYPPNAYAKWIFRCLGGIIETSCFTRVRTSPGCKKDKLALFTGKGFNDGTRYCGRNDKLLGTFKDRLKAVFKSDATIKNKGVSCTFTCSAA